ncbi:DUF3093 domain-containing protein [Amycolatopsis alkalitolerans]|uniref:DUF3093 domain-containing protein n=1 Tax=Amycolatopsis alkalitolerans TaxID=2547244 RepID=A0A5C4M3K8_9PSEU|nr:DUF3093 domain-containing protein [Amycolatopsis alkalitolerans]TNC27656.1 DUF3093 domain-containing protein [Amycolatopsis alkalitolerans]
MGESASAADAGVDSTARTEQKRHNERLYLAWWGWPLPLIAAGLLAAEVHMGYPGVRAWLPYLILVPLMAGWMFLLGRSRVTITGSRLVVGKANLPLEFVGQVDIIDKAHKRKALGPELDPTAFVLHRGWIGPVVRVHLTDPDDPTPYWIFSTRKPEAVAGLLRDSPATR